MARITVYIGKNEFDCMGKDVKFFPNIPKFLDEVRHDNHFIAKVIYTKGYELSQSQKKTVEELNNGVIFELFQKVKGTSKIK